MSGEPPDTVPDGLSAEEYYGLGTWYLQSEKLEQARDVFQRVIALDPASENAAGARKFLASRIPKHPIPSESIKKCTQIGWQSMGMAGEARAQYRQLIDEHPDFEWPHKELGDICLREGDLEAAKASLEAALKINSEYSAAMTSLASVHAADMEYDKALIQIERALAATPPVDESQPAVQLLPSEPDQLRALRRSIEILKALDS